MEWFILFWEDTTTVSAYVYTFLTHNKILNTYPPTTAVNNSIQCSPNQQITHNGA